MKKNHHTKFTILLSLLLPVGLHVNGQNIGKKYPVDSTMKEQLIPGLIGTWYGSTGLKRPKGSHRLTSLTIDLSEMNWGNDWSAYWQGSIWAPVDGEVTFKVESNDAVVLQIDGRRVVDLLRGDHIASGTISFIRGRNLSPNTHLRSSSGWTGKSGRAVELGGQRISNFANQLFFSHPTTATGSAFRNPDSHF